MIYLFLIQMCHFFIREPDLFWFDQLTPGHGNLKGYKEDIRQFRLVRPNVLPQVRNIFEM